MAKQDAAAIRKLPKGRGGMAAWKDQGSSFWDDVAKKKDELKGLSAPEFANAYESARDAKDVLDARHKAEMRPVTVELAAIYDMLPEVFEAQKVDTLRTSGGHSISTSPDIQTSVVDAEKLIEWAKQNGYERKLTLPAPTVKSIALERLRANVPFPEGVEVKGITKLNYRKVK